MFPSLSPSDLLGDREKCQRDEEIETVAGGSFHSFFIVLFFGKTKVREIHQFVCIKEICTNPNSSFLLWKAWHPTRPQSQASRGAWDRKSNYSFKQKHADIPLESWVSQPCPRVEQPA